MTEASNNAPGSPQSPETTEVVSPTTPRTEQRQAKRDEQVRSRLREVEAERDQLRDRYDRMVTGEVHRLLSGVLSDPAMAIRAANVPMEDFIDAESGQVNQEAVAAFGTDFAKDHPGFKVGPPPISGVGQRPVRRDELAQSTTSTSWSDVLKQRRS